MRSPVLVSLPGVLAACTGRPDADDAAIRDAAAHQAHVAYVAAINANDLAKFDAVVTDDVVYVPPNSKPLIGRAAVKEFAAGYFAAYRTVWQKTSLDFTVDHDTAYETYQYKSVDTPRTDGPAAGTPVATDTGTGINVYRRGADGVWRVARDAWATEKPAAN